MSCPVTHVGAGGRDEHMTVTQCALFKLIQPLLLQCQASLETKGGPIQRLVIHNVTKFQANDLIVADSRGTVTVLCNGQILTRKAISQHALQCLQVDEDKCRCIVGGLAQLFSLRKISGSRNRIKITLW